MPHRSVHHTTGEAYNARGDYAGDYVATSTIKNGAYVYHNVMQKKDLFRFANDFFMSSDHSNDHIILPIYSSDDNPNLVCPENAVTNGTAVANVIQLQV